MVRFRVIKGSHLLLGVAAVALALVVCLLAFRLFAVEAGETAAAQTGGDLVEEASKLRRRPRARSSPLPPAAPASRSTCWTARRDKFPPAENEHTDETVPPLDLAAQEKRFPRPPSRACRACSSTTRTRMKPMSRRKRPL